VGASTSATLTGSYSGVTRTAVLTVNPASLTIRLSVSPTSVAGGMSVTGTVTLSGRVPSGSVLVTLASGNAAVRVPATLVLPAGYTSRSFTLTTRAVSTTTNVVLTASTSASSSSTILTVRPPFVRKVTLAPAKVKAGGKTTATVVLDAAAPAGGVPVAITCASSAATVPSTVTVPAGKKKVSFKVQTTGTSATSVAVTATTGTEGNSAQLTILAKKAAGK
jgi:hypothetical protein